MERKEIKPPYLIFVGGEGDSEYAKTGAGIAKWRPEVCLGQLGVDKNAADLGLPKMTVEEASKAGARSLLIGVASVGGGIADEWLDYLVEAASLGMDIVGGIHQTMEDVPRLHEAAVKSGAKLINVRIPPKNLPVGNGRKRTGMRLLTVGTDCAVGKKYTALTLEKEMIDRGMNAEFRASGQTGIMISGKGIPIDSVVVDFVTGAAELLSPDNSEDHWDIIEGQGGILHPGYGAVSTGLLIGSQPDAFVVCHEAKRTQIRGWADFPLPSIKDVIERTCLIGALTNPNIKCVGISINTSKLQMGERESYLKRLSDEYGLPCIDPLKEGAHDIVENLKQTFSI